MESRLDISVIVPIRDCLPALVNHVESLQDWVGFISEIIVVDSHSKDGSLQYIKENLRHDNIVFLNHPPGLYESWNAAIERATSRYTYVATAGDTIEFSTLNSMYEAAERYKVSVVVSPPQLIDEYGKALPSDWPIHEFIEYFMGNGSLYRLRGRERLIFSALYLPGTLIGSSASNLYLTDCLQRDPFSAEYGHAGDSAWALSRPIDEDWLVYGSGKSSFVVHQNNLSNRHNGRKARTDLCTLAEQQLSSPCMYSESSCSVDYLNHVQGLIELWKSKESVARDYKSLRDHFLPWYLRPIGWRIRREKQQVRRELVSLRQKIIRALIDNTI